MLTEQRYEKILNLLQEKKSVTMTEIKELLDTSESTVRRDITALHKAGKLIKVFGGAVAVDHTYTPNEPTVAQKVEVNKEEKQMIAKYATSLLAPDDFVYLDAGTSTGYMIEYISDSSVTFVTNAVAHAKRLAKQGNRVLLIGGELKGSTEAIIGNQAVGMLQNYHFSKGFFGTNGITKQEGFTTPDAEEAMIKKTAMQQCRTCYVLADHSKFGQVSSVTFSGFSDAVVITDRKEEEYRGCTNLIVTDVK